MGNTADDFGVIGGLLGYQLHRTDLMAMDLLAEALAEFGLTAARATGRGLSTTPALATQPAG